MKSKEIIILVILILFNSLSPTIFVYGQEKLSIGDRSPAKNSKVETIKGILQVEIISKNKPLSFAWVNFYIDDEHIGAELTDNDGIAGKTFNLLDAFGQHTWKVKVNKQGYDTIWSPKWRFDYQPRPILTLISEYGEVYGNGSYTYGKTANFGVKPDIINLENGKRLVFHEWVTYHENGYSGIENPSNATMLNNILEIAVWKTQYYLNMSCELPKAVFPKSGWYDEGAIVTIRVDPLPGTEFQYWNGFGKSSYTGTDLFQTFRLDGPLKEEAIFNREKYSLSVKSEYGKTFGSGTYSAWENVSFGIENIYINISKGERAKFTGWNLESNYGYTGNNTENQIEISENIIQQANWIKQYYVNINSSEGGNPISESMWIDENSIIILEAKGEEDYSFSGWNGVGDASYTGQDNNYSIRITSPVNQTALWKKIFTVNIKSELPVKGSGEYLDGETVTIEAVKSDGLLIRKIFQKWAEDIDSTSNPFTFTISRDMVITATYVVNYTYLLIIVTVLFLVTGSIIYKILSQ